MSPAPNDDDAERRAALEARLGWLDEVRARHRRSQRRAPLWFGSAVLSIPAAVIWGPAVAFYIVVVAVSLVSLIFYVAWNHEQECSVEQDAIRVMLAGGPAAVAAAEDAQSGGPRPLPANPLEARTGEERDQQRARHDRNRRPRLASL